MNADPSKTAHSRVQGDDAGRRERDGDVREKRGVKAAETEALKEDLAGHPSDERATSGLDAASGAAARDTAG